MSAAALVAGIIVAGCASLGARPSRMLEAKSAFELSAQKPLESAKLVFKGTFSEEKTEHFAVNENNRMQYYFVKTHYPHAEITTYPSIDACLKAVIDGKAG